MPDTVTTLGSFAFNGCWKLKQIKLSANLTQINAGVFRQCDFSQITIGESTKQISASAFRECVLLRSVVFPQGLERIGRKAFYNCSSLKSIVIPETVKSFGKFAVGYEDDRFDKRVRTDGFTIYGKHGSEAERYAKESGFAFCEENDE